MEQLMKNTRMMMTHLYVLMNGRYLRQTSQMGNVLFATACLTKRRPSRTPLTHGEQVSEVSSIELIVRMLKRSRV